MPLACTPNGFKTCLDTQLPEQDRSAHLGQRQELMSFPAAQGEEGATTEDHWRITRPPALPALT